ncbi:MAG TPA: Dabb family protein [Streptosporangiaceae bacterium]
MIRHVVLFAWVPDATDKQKQQVADELRTLPPLMTGLRAFDAGPSARIVEGNFDFAVVADFDDTQSYLAYRNHPAHRAVIDQVITPIVRERTSVQYEITGTRG